MKKVVLFFALVMLAFNSFAQSVVYVKGYTKSNGTYVQPHYRTAPNNTITDNFSYYGNYNPYTGSYGTVKPYNYSSSTNSYVNYNIQNRINSFKETYSSTTYTPLNGSYYSSSNSRTIYTGPRGGTYYINSNGNKTYVR